MHSSYYSARRSLILVVRRQMKNHNNHTNGIVVLLVATFLSLLSVSAFAEMATNESSVEQEKPSEITDIYTQRVETMQSLLYRYKTALQKQIRKNWNTKKIPQPFRCDVTFTQMPGGQVTSVAFSNCPDNKKARRSIEKALLKEPMPYFGFELVFNRRLAMTLCYPESSCD